MVQNYRIDVYVSQFLKCFSLIGETNIDSDCNIAGRRYSHTGFLHNLIPSLNRNQKQKNHKFSFRFAMRYGDKEIFRHRTFLTVLLKWNRQMKRRNIDRELCFVGEYAT